MMTTKLVNEYAIALRDILYLFHSCQGFMSLTAPFDKEWHSPLACFEFLMSSGATARRLLRDSRARNEKPRFLGLKNTCFISGWRSLLLEVQL
jgi:hypothetical protein